MKQQTKITWHTEKRKLKELKGYEFNPRSLSDEQYADLKKSLEKFDLAEIPAINTNNIIIAGHQRIKILADLYGAEHTIDVRVPSRKLTDKEYQEYNIRSNKNSGDWDFDILANNFELNDLIDWGFKEKELDINLWQTNKSDEELDAIPDPPKKALSKLGDIFLIDGKHRVMCGDSTKKEDVEKLMDGKKADMIFTDPPYNVDYEGGLSLDKNGGLKSNRRTKLINDNLDIYPLVIPLMAEFCNGAIYTWFAGTKAKSIYQTVEECGEIHSLIIWVKNGGYGALNANYKQKHEPCLYWKAKNKKLNFIGSSTETTVWDINKDGINKLHPTQKPVALALKAIKNHSVGLILDLFLGSGSTLIACEQTNRICYGMEIDPIYIDVILKRYHTLYPENKIQCLTRKDFNFKLLFS